MAKRPTIAMPAPKAAPATPDAFVLAGHPEPIPKAPTKRLTIDVDAEMHRAFKMKALQDGKDMRDVMIEAIRAYVDGRR